MCGTGDVSEVFRALGNSTLQTLHLVSLPLTGSVEAGCSEGGLLTRLMHFAAEDVSISGNLPSCLWKLGVAIFAHTDVRGALPSVPSNASTSSLIVWGVCSTRSFENGGRGGNAGAPVGLIGLVPL
jgi:hypothetical protein